MVCQKAKIGVVGAVSSATLRPAIALPTELPSALSPNSSPPLQKSRHFPSSEGKASENGRAKAVRPAIAAVSAAKPSIRLAKLPSAGAPTLAQSDVSHSKR
ncbi:unannotated protein [freshwater metagenome]|uniref:Unannotated protein n=1 Tax=freshwater metagenome TaxID=449393 RepID=A0A6J6URE1_9ZZZZ